VNIFGRINRYYLDLNSSPLYLYLRIQSAIFAYVIGPDTSCKVSNYWESNNVAGPQFIYQLKSDLVKIRSQYILCRPCWDMSVPVIQMKVVKSFQELRAIWRNYNHFHSMVQFAWMDSFELDLHFWDLGFYHHGWNRKSVLDYYDRICSYQRIVITDDRRLAVQCGPLQLLLEIISQHLNIIMSYTYRPNSNRDRVSNQRELAGIVRAYHMRTVRFSPTTTEVSLSYHSFVYWSEFDMAFKYHICFMYGKDAFDLYFLFRPFHRWAVPLFFLPKIGIYFISTILSWRKQAGKYFSILDQIVLFGLLSSYEIFLSADVTVPPKKHIFERVQHLLDAYSIVVPGYSGRQAQLMWSRFFGGTSGVIAQGMSHANFTDPK